MEAVTRMLKNPLIWILVVLFFGALAGANYASRNWALFAGSVVFVCLATWKLFMGLVNYQRS